MNQVLVNTTSSGRNVACSAKRRKKPDYASRRAGQQEENLRRRANYHQHALSARVNQRDARDDGGDAVRARSQRSVALSSSTRRRGRPAHRRSPDDSPLRDGNRDRLIGMLTQRAAKTLEYYFMETNLAYHTWLQEYVRQNPIPVEGNWDAVSGEDFLRKLLTGGLHATKYTGGVTDPLFCSVGSIGIDPRAIGQRIMDIRSALAKEFIEDLNDVAEENAILMRECAMASLTALDSMDTDEEEAGMAITPHPEMLDAEPGPIPDTVAEFMTRAIESDVERYHREREEKGEDATTDTSASSSVDEVRPGLDDINEFEAELEAPDKWARRFRILRESEASAQADKGRKDEESTQEEDAPAAEAGALADEDRNDEESVEDKSKDVEAAQVAEAAADDKADEPGDKGSAGAESSQDGEKDVPMENAETSDEGDKPSDIKYSAEDHKDASSEGSKKDSK